MCYCEALSAVVAKRRFRVIACFTFSSILERYTSMDFLSFSFYSSNLFIIISSYSVSYLNRDSTTHSLYYRSISSFSFIF